MVLHWLLGKKSRSKIVKNLMKQAQLEKYMMSGITIITSKSQFDQCIASGVVLVDFWATWCGPCRMQLPILEEIAMKYNDRATVAKVNVDDNENLAQEFGVEAIPTLFLFKDGVQIQKFTGVQSAISLSAALDSALP